MYQRWAPEQNQLIPAAKASMPMARMLKTLTTMTELLEDSSHVIRFHSLKAQQNVVPWCLQLSLRDAELWTLMSLTTHNTIWSLMGMTVKNHNQQMSKPAHMLADLLQPSPAKRKGHGKGKTKAKAAKST